MSESHPVGPSIRRFLQEHVIVERNLSRNTQQSYRDSIRLLLSFIRDRHHIEPTELSVEQITADLVRAFLAHLETERANSVPSRNLRLAALHALFRFIGRLEPELIEQAAQIQQIPLRRSPIPSVGYLEKDEIDALLGAPDRHSAQGRRDYALLLFLYNTGARADEAARVTVGDLSFGSSPSVRLLGKGRRVRFCPLWPHTIETLGELLGSRVDGPREARLFLNVRGGSMTRFGIHTLVVRNVENAAKVKPSLLEKRVSPHTIRHSTAVHLLRAGVDINTIRAWLGHVLLVTTNRYAEVDLEMKAKALATCAAEGTNTPNQTANWREDHGLLEFLSRL